MKKEDKNRIILIIIIILAIIVLSYLFRQKILPAPQQPEEVTVTVAGINVPVVYYVYPIPNEIPTELSTKTVAFNFYVYDADGAQNIVSGLGDFSMTGESTRSDLSCARQTDIDNWRTNYSCTIDMIYWDGEGDWTITAQATDEQANTGINNTETFYYQELQAMVIAPDLLTWPTVSPGSVNQVSNNDPTIINNTGNYKGLVYVESYNLTDVDQDEWIATSDFAVDIDTGGTPPTECDGVTLTEATGTGIAGSYSNPGDLSLGGGSGQEEIYYCIPSVPLVSSQTYSATATKGNNWYVRYYP